MSQLVKDAFRESAARYPESIDALVFFATAAGLFEYGLLRMEDITLARLMAGLPQQSAAIFNEVP